MIWEFHSRAFPAFINPTYDREYDTPPLKGVGRLSTFIGYVYKVYILITVLLSLS